MFGLCYHGNYWNVKSEIISPQGLTNLPNNAAVTHLRPVYRAHPEPAPLVVVVKKVGLGSPAGVNPVTGRADRDFVLVYLCLVAFG